MLTERKGKGKERLATVHQVIGVKFVISILINMERCDKRCFTICLPTRTSQPAASASCAEQQIGSEPHSLASRMNPKNALLASPARCYSLLGVHRQRRFATTLSLRSFI